MEVNLWSGAGSKIRRHRHWREANSWDVERKPSDKKIALYGALEVNDSAVIVQKICVLAGPPISLAVRTDRCPRAEAAGREGNQRRLLPGL
jgi:hypothetical protein